jgi:hypothetical protein
MKANLTQLLNDPSTPYWARNLILAIKDKDPVEVCNVLEAIVEAIAMDLEVDTDAAGRLLGVAS